MRFRIAFATPALLLPMLVFSAGSAFSRSLYLGIRGEDVRNLQKVLNSDPETRIAMSGPGSAGAETDYFGPATKKALIKFQEKYKSEVLAPSDLVQGTGFFGGYSRLKAEKLLASGNSKNSASLPPETPVSKIATTSNPNLVNIDLYIDAVKKTGAKQGFSSDKLAYLEDKIRKEAESPIDYRKQFFDFQKAAYLKKIGIVSLDSPIGKFFDKVLTFVTEKLLPEKVLASTGLPFGGYITYVNPGICDCPPGIVTQIFVASPNPNPSQSNLLLNYLNGSEAFSYYNIPQPSIAVLGEYEPGVQSCITYYGASCGPFPAEGEITPIVGSSLIP